MRSAAPFLLLALASSPDALLAQGAQGTGGRPGVPPGLQGTGPERSGSVLFDARFRFESVRHEAFESRARALTGRVRAGYQTGQLDGVSLLFEVDGNRALGIDDFNSGVNGRTTYPLVADPDSERVNRLHLTWTGDGGALFVAGRQRIIHDDARFVGNVGFRQNEQTFDALRLRTRPVDGYVLDYAWGWQVNRTPGRSSPAGTEDARLHLLRVSGPFLGATLTGFGWWTDFRETLAPLSGRTLGLRLSGSGTALPPRGNDPEVVARWLAEFAFQRPDDREATRPPGISPEVRPPTLSQRRLEVGLDVPDLGVASTLSEERLGGDGPWAFSFPLGTLHAFQGATDVFLRTPPGGLRDRRVSLTWAPSPGTIPLTGGLPARLTLGYHTFTLEDPTRVPDTGEGPAEAGREWNAQLRLHPRPGLSLVARVADFQARDDDTLLRTGAPWESNQRKSWFWVEFTLP
jgi:hypothetical protein